MIEGNKVHNFVLSLLALTDLYLEGIRQELEQIENNFDLLLTLTSKYSQFQNTIINM